MHDPDTLVAEFPPFKARRRLHLPSLVEVWHHDPSDYDSTTCGRNFRTLACWRHWQVRIVPLRRLARLVIDRCAQCGGPLTGHNRVSHGHADALPWWWGRPNVYHRECSQREIRWAKQRRTDAEADGYQRGYCDATFGRQPNTTGA